MSGVSFASMSFVTSRISSVTNTRMSGEPGNSSAIVFARKPCSMRFFSFVELYCSAP
jgi:hypothetical protein